MKLNSIIRDLLTYDAVVEEKREIAENVYHLRLKGMFLKQMSYQIGQHLHVLVQPHIEGGILETSVNRSYSIWNHDRERGELDLAISNLGSGPGAKWITTINRGDTIFFTKPTGRFVLGGNEFKHHFFIGDISALSHLYFMKRNLPESKSYTGVIYGVNSRSYFPDIDGEYPFEFIKKEDKMLSVIEQKIALLPPQELELTMIYIGGDGDVCISLNKLLKEMYGLSKKNLNIKPFWRKGKKGL